MVEAIPLDVQNQLVGQAKPFVKSKRTEKKTKKTFKLITDTPSTPSSELGDDVGEWLESINNLGQEFARTQKYATLQEYKRAIQAMLEKVVERGFELGHDVGITNPKTLSQKKYSIIRLVDSKLDKIVALFLQKQLKTLEILQALGDIQGLLVNILT